VLSNSNNSVDEIGLHLLDHTFPLPPLPKPRTAISLPAELLETYVGTYPLAPTFTLAVTREGAQLYLQATGQPRFALFAEKEGEFFLKEVDAQISFTKDSTGVITALVLHQNGMNQRAAKK
jgi:serine-type D-Ala-D-Ala carboxypeptidase/endopeptidase